MSFNSFAIDFTHLGWMNSKISIDTKWIILFISNDLMTINERNEDIIKIIDINIIRMAKNITYEFNIINKLTNNENNEKFNINYPDDI